LGDLHRRIIRAFRDEYVTAAGRLLGDTQTSYVVALAFDLLPEKQRQGALDRLVRQLERRFWRLSTGFVGTPLLCPVLTRFGREDVAYRLLLQEAFPSWLYTVNQGATTMWERWNSYTHEHGFGPVGMNSFNHYAYGSIGDWMYGTVAGLRVDMSEGDSPPICIAPKVGHGLTNAKAELMTPFGNAASEWEMTDGVVRLNVSIPANAWAEVAIPAGSADIRIDAEAGESHLEELVVHEEVRDGVYVFRAAAGRYAFTWKCNGGE
jgi:alpha-L-rhamnosidase